MVKVSRRNFVAGSAMAIIGMGLAGCAPEGDAKSAVTGDAQTWNEETDVIVVGFGGGGGAAAIEAYDNGAEVLVLDSSETPGGATSINGGVIQCGGSSVQEAAGIKDSAEAWFRCLQTAMEDGFDENHVRRLTEQGAENIEWLISLGAEIPAQVHPTDTHSIPESGLYYSDASCELFPDEPLAPRGHVVVGQGGGFLKALRAGADERGIEIRKNTPVTDLVQDDTGRVVGVMAGEGSKQVRIRARKGVIIATGHFNENEEMVERHVPQTKRNPRSVITGHPSATGDGHRMAEAIGAEMVGMNNISPSMYTAGAETAIHSMMVNLHCQRFWSEQGYTNNFRGSRLTQQPNEQGFAIFDENIRAAYGEVDPAEAEFKGETIEELAQSCGLDPKLLTAAVEHYNQMCRDGKDLEYGKHPEFMDEIAQGPFYAMPLAYVWMTSGAIRINENAQVMKPTGDAIPGLYAAGIIAAGRMGRQNPGSGYNMQWNFYTGRLAGKSAAAEGAEAVE